MLPTPSTMAGRRCSSLRDIGVQGLEVYSANGELPSDAQLARAEELGFVLVAGSGFRGGRGFDVGDCHTLIDADVRSGRDLAVAIRSGHVQPVFGSPPPSRPVPQEQALRNLPARPEGIWKH